MKLIWIFQLNYKIMIKLQENSIDLPLLLFIDINVKAINLKD
jgi:hypothetical protein